MMDDSTKILYREIVERYDKIIWTHKIHLCQADIYTRKNKSRNRTLLIVSALVSAAAITNVLRWFPDRWILPLLAFLSLLLTYLTVKYRSENLEKAASENEHFAARMHHLRNQYAGLLSDIKAGVVSKEEIIQYRKQLEQYEDLIYSGIVPATSPEAVKAADYSLKTNQDSTTKDEEIELLVSSNLKL